MPVSVSVLTEVTKGIRSFLIQPKAEGGAFSYFSYGDVHLRQKMLPQNIVTSPPEHPKISAKNRNFFKNSNKFCKNFKNCLHL